MKPDLLLSVPNTIWKPPKRSGIAVARMIWRRRYTVIVTAFVLCAIAALVVRQLPAIYRAETLILVESQRIPERFVPPTVSNELKDRLATLSQQILSYSRLLEVVEKYDLYHAEKTNHSREEIVEMMKSDVGIQLEQGWSARSRTENRPSAFRISYQGTNPELVALVANQLGGLFIDENLRSREVQAVGTSEFLASQLVEAKKRLEEQETRMSSYKVKFNGELPEQENMLLATLSQLQLRMQAANEAVTRAEQTKTILDASIGAAEDTEQGLSDLIEQSAGASAARSAPMPDGEPQDTEALRRKIEVARGMWGDNHPDLVAMRQQLQRLEAEEQFAAATPKSSGAARNASGKPANPASARTSEMLLQRQERISSMKTQRAVTRDQIQAAIAERDRLSQEILKVQQRLSHLPVREQEIMAVKRDYEISRANYQSLLDKGMSADLSAEMERRQKAERFTIIDSARVPQKPVKPNRPLLYSLGAALGLLLGIGVGLGREMQRNVLLGEWDVPKGLPVLGRIPEIVTIKPAPEAPQRRRRLLRVTVGLVLVILVAAVAAGAWYLEVIPQSVLARLHG